MENTLLLWGEGGCEGTGELLDGRMNAEMSSKKSTITAVLDMLKLKDGCFCGSVIADNNNEMLLHYAYLIEIVT